MSELFGPASDKSINTRYVERVGAYGVGLTAVFEGPHEEMVAFVPPGSPNTYERIIDGRGASRQVTAQYNSPADITGSSPRPSQNEPRRITWDLVPSNEQLSLLMHPRMQKQNMDYTAGALSYEGVTHEQRNLFTELLDRVPRLSWFQNWTRVASSESTPRTQTVDAWFDEYKSDGSTTNGSTGMVACRDLYEYFLASRQDTFEKTHWRLARVVQYSPNYDTATSTVTPTSQLSEINQFAFALDKFSSVVTADVPTVITAALGALNAIVEWPNADAYVITPFRGSKVFFKEAPVMRTGPGDYVTVTEAWRLLDDVPGGVYTLIP